MSGTVSAAFRAAGISPALIGGLALSAHDVVRATQDIDFLVDGDLERVRKFRRSGLRDARFLR